MKKYIYSIVMIVICTVTLTSCEYEYDDYENPQIYIPQSGLSLHQFKVADTTYSLSVYVAGIRDNGNDIHVKLNSSQADFDVFNQENGNIYTLLPANAYKIVEAGEAVSGYVFNLQEAEDNAKQHNQDSSVPLLHYIDPSTTTIVSDGYDVVIPKGQTRGNVTFTVSGSELDLGKEYILPFMISSVSNYEVNEEKSMAFFRVIIE